MRRQRVTLGRNKNSLPEDAFDMHEMEEAPPVEDRQDWATIPD